MSEMMNTVAGYPSGAGLADAGRPVGVASAEQVFEGNLRLRIIDVVGELSGRRGEPIGSPLAEQVDRLATKSLLCDCGLAAENSWRIE